MSATDSDNSIDWLASDYEDNESEQESDSSRKHSQREARPATTPPPAHLGPADSGRRVKDCDGNWSEVREASGRGSPPSCTVTWDTTVGLCKRQHGEKTNPQHALKRPRGSAEEERRDQQHLSSPSESDRAFSRKVSASLAPV